MRRWWLGCLLSLGACQLLLNASEDDLVEVDHCEDGVDNDGNNLTDCQDPACTADPVCFVLVRCGDAILDAEEECDDGNQNNGDGCDQACQREADLFVDCSAALGGDGSEGAPFSTLQEAIGATPAGAAADVVVSSSAGVSCAGGLLLDGGRTMTFQARGDVTLDVQGAGLIVSGATGLFRDFSIVGDISEGTFGGSPSAQMIQVQNGAQLAVLSSTLQNNGGGNTALALNVAGNGARALLDRVKVTNNAGGGVLALNGGELIVTNSLLLNNGTSGTSVFAAAQSEGSVLFAAHNTLFGNRIGEQSGEDGGTTDCRELGVGRFVASLAANNEAVAFTPTCTYDQNIAFGAALGGSNLDVDPLFVDANAANFHLQAGSPAIDAATLPISAADFPFDPEIIFGALVGQLNLLGHDHEGLPRPLGAASDLGAFEDF